MGFTTRNPVILGVLNNRYCGGCPLSARADHPRRVEARNRALELNSQHVPGAVRVLLVGESPPSALMRDPGAYFYASGPERANSLAYHVSKVLFGDRVVGREEFFGKLEELGVYLVDVVKCPVNDLPPRERRRVATHCVRYLKEELRLLNPGRVVFVGRTTFRAIKSLLNLDLPCYSIPLPFGSRSNVENFRRGLAEVLSTSLEGAAPQSPKSLTPP